MTHVDASQLAPNKRHAKKRMNIFIFFRLIVLFKPCKKFFSLTYWNTTIWVDVCTVPFRLRKKILECSSRMCSRRTSFFFIFRLFIPQKGCWTRFGFRGFELLKRVFHFSVDIFYFSAYVLKNVLFQIPLDVFSSNKFFIILRYLFHKEKTFGFLRDFELLKRVFHFSVDIFYFFCVCT